jgi:hypothetical protein
LDVIEIDLIVISIAHDGTPSSTNDCITKRDLPPLTLSDGSIYYQTCFYCANMVKTIISMAAILAACNVFVRWNQEGFKDPSVPGSIQFMSHNGFVFMYFQLHCHNGLYY